MAATIGNIADIMEEWAPCASAAGFDNVGLLIGSRAEPVRRVLLALDPTAAVAEEAVVKGAQIVVCHHPIIFEPVTRLDEDNYAAAVLMPYIRHNIAVYAAHTNLDKADGGVNDMLSQRIGLTGCEPIIDGYGRVGSLEAPMTQDGLLAHVKAALGSTAVLFAGGAKGMISRVAVASGSCAKGVEAAHKAGAQALIVGESKHHETLIAERLGMLLIAASHGATEAVVLPAIGNRLQSGTDAVQLIDVEILFSEADVNTWRCV